MVPFWERQVNPQPIRAIIELALRVAKHPQELVKADDDKGRDPGLTDEEIEEIMVVAAFGVYSDIGADTLQIEVDPVTAEALTPLREMMTEQDTEQIQAARYGLLFDSGSMY